MTDAVLHDPRFGDPEDGSDSRPVERGPMLRRLLVVLAGVCIGLVLVDRIVAWWDRDQGADGGDSSIMEHELLVWTGRPHFENPEFETVLDRYGNRSDEIPADAPLDELRIAGFGASQVYGAGGAKQPDVWHNELGRLLDAGLEHPVRVVNGGVMAYSGLQVCRRAALLLDALEPDLLFVVIGTGAQSLLDPSAARDAVRYGDGPRDLVPRDLAETWPRATLPVVGGLHRFFSDHSAIYRRHRAKFQGAGGERGAAIQRWILSRAPQPQVVEDMLATTLAEVDALAAACAARGVELRVLVLAEPEADTEQGWRDYLAEAQRSGAPPAGTPRTEPTDVLAQMLTERGHTVWNFYDEVASMGPQRGRFTMQDRKHWNAAGHDVFARGVMQRLRAERVLATLVERRRAAPRAQAFGPSPFEEPGR